VRGALGAPIATTFDNPTGNAWCVARALLCSVDANKGSARGDGVARKDRDRASGKKRDRDRDDDGGGGVGGVGGDATKRKPYGSTNAADLCKREMPMPPSHYVLSAADMADMEYPIPRLARAAGGDTAGGGDAAGADAAGDGGDAAGGDASVDDRSRRLIVPEGYVVTQPSGGGIARAPHLSMVAIDCEMCYSGVGENKKLELARASAVGPDGAVIYDKLVMPKEAITDYNTTHSGITAEQMRGVTTTLRDVQRELLELIAAETILVGHSLENDLKRLKMMHANCVDTVALYPHKRGPPYRNKLSGLTEKFLGRKIQEGTHDSVADARATMELALLKVNARDTATRTTPFAW
jgi:RNA exonuclease 1